MPALSDQVRRDAEHAARMETSIVISKYIRRILEASKAHIASELARHEGGQIDGTALGREAASLAIAGFLGTGEVREAIEAPADPEQIEA